MRHPDKTYDPPITVLRAPAIESAILQPKHASVYEWNSGDIRIFVSPQGVDQLPAWALRFGSPGPSGIYYFDQVATPLAFVESWKTTYEQKVGPVPRLDPVVDREMQVRGLRPFTTPYRIEEALQLQGWKAQKSHQRDWAVRRQFGPLWVQIAYYGGPDLYLTPLSTLSEAIEPIRLSWDQTSLTEITERSEGAARLWKSKQVRKPAADRSDAVFEELRGTVALKAWRLAIETEILDLFRSPWFQQAVRKRAGFRTSDVVPHVLNLSRLDVSWLTREEKGREIRAALERLARTGQIERDTNNPSDIRWWDRPSS